MITLPNSKQRLILIKGVLEVISQNTGCLYKPLENVLSGQMSISLSQGKGRANAIKVSMLFNSELKEEKSLVWSRILRWFSRDYEREKLQLSSKVLSKLKLFTRLTSGIERNHYNYRQILCG